MAPYIPAVQRRGFTALLLTTSFWMLNVGSVYGNSYFCG